MSTFLNNPEADIDAKRLKDAFKEGVDGIAFYGGANVGSRTMMDALIPAVDTFIYSDNSLNDAVKVATVGAEGTASMLKASAGRSNYSGSSTHQGTPDPGAIAVSLMLKSISEAVSGSK